MIKTAIDLLHVLNLESMFLMAELRKNLNIKYPPEVRSNGMTRMWYRYGVS